MNEHRDSQETLKGQLKVVFLKNSSCFNHARLHKFIDIFQTRGIDHVAYIWNRASPLHPKETALVQGVPKSGLSYICFYLLWIAKLTIKIIVSKNRKTKIRYFAVDLDAAFACYLASFIRPDIFYVYDIHDEFAIRYSLPSPIKVLIKSIDKRVRAKAKLIIHVDENRVASTDRNYCIIPNVANDFFNGKFQENGMHRQEEKIFAVTGYLSKMRGTNAIRLFAQKNQKFKFIVAGEIVDESAEELVKLSNVEFIGYLPQSVLFEKIRSASAIFSLYDPALEINRLAASNKLYDAMMLGLPVIVNEGVRASSLVEAEGIGFVISFDFDNSWSVLSDSDELEFKAKGARGRQFYERNFLGAGSFQGRSELMINTITR